MSKFTIILECLGGTYTEQIIAQDINQAAVVWMDVFLKERLLGDDTKKLVKKFKKDFEEYGLSKIDNRDGLYYFCFDFKKKSVWGHFIHTS